MLKKTLKVLAGDDYVASVRDEAGDRIKLAGHLPYTPAHEELFEQHDVRAAVIYRDPRDNFLQLVRRTLQGYCDEKFTRPNTHPTAVRYHQLVKRSEGQRGDAPFVEFYVDGIGGRETLDTIFQVTEWRHSPRVLSVRFEELVDLYGDAPDVQRRTIHGIADFVGASPTDAQIERLAAKGRDWLRKKVAKKDGYLTSWRDVFTDQDREAFKARFGHLVVDLGYEQDDDW
jgi:hypothetical protein